MWNSDCCVEKRIARNSVYYYFYNPRSRSVVDGQLCIRRAARSTISSSPSLPIQKCERQINAQHPVSIRSGVINNLDQSQRIVGIDLQHVEFEQAWRAAFLKLSSPGRE